MSEDGEDFVNISVIPLDAVGDGVSLIAEQNDSVTQLTVPANVNAPSGLCILSVASQGLPPLPHPAKNENGCGSNCNARFSKPCRLRV